MVEDQRVLKIKRLTKHREEAPTEELSESAPKRYLDLEEVKTFEFRELKEKKAIFMNDTGRKVFYRVQNMGIIYWDYFTDEQRKFRVEIPDATFYSAV